MTKSGSTLTEHYHLGEVIGEGQYGCVRLAGALSGAQSLYVCKTLNKPQGNSQEELTRHRALVAMEVRAMALVEGHPNIVQLRNVYEDSRSHHLILEYCSHGDLFDLLSNKGPTSEDMASCVVGQLASALFHCHSLGLVHRDVKPENIFISGWTKNASGKKVPQVKLGDFGASAIPGKKLKLKQLIGTQNYMAPEMVLNKEYSVEVDVWSLGVILYIMLAGVFPFHGANREEAFSCIVTKELNFCSKRWNSISPAARDLLLWMLQKDSRKRATAFDVLCHPWIQCSIVPGKSSRLVGS